MPKEQRSDAEAEHLRDLFSRKWINYPELKRIERDTGKVFKRGRFTKAETDICLKAVDEYLELKRINRQEFIDMMFVRNNEKNELRSEQCKDFFIQVAGKLDGRPIVNVYHFLRRRLHPNNRGETWTASEDDDLKRLYLIHGPQWEKIGKEMGRFHVACRDRYKKIEAAYTRGPWTKEETSRLEAAYKQVEQGGKPEGVAAWTFIAAQVGSRSANQCQWKWTESLLFKAMHPDLKRLDWELAEDRALVNSIYDMGIEHQSEIVWTRLQSGLLAKFTPARIRHRWNLLKKRVRNEASRTVDELCDILMRELAPLSPELISDSEITDKDMSSSE